MPPHRHRSFRRDARQGGRARPEPRDAERHAQGHGRHLHGFRRQRVRQGARDLHDLGGPRSGGGATRDAARGEARRHPRDPDPLPQRAPGDGLARGPRRSCLHAAGLEVQPRAQAAARAGRPHAGAGASGQHVQRVAPREVRQPEVARRLAALALALVLAAPVTRDAVSLVLSAAFLVEFLSDGALPALDALTPAPVRESLGPSADRWTGASLGVAPPLVLVHGYAPMGKDDPRLARAAALLARTGFDVTVPTLPGLTRGRLRPDDAAPVVAALATRPGPWAMVSVSIGAAPAFAAAADPRVRDRVGEGRGGADAQDRKSTRLNSSHGYISYAVFCLKKKKNKNNKERAHAQYAY